MRDTSFVGFEPSVELLIAVAVTIVVDFQIVIATDRRQISDVVDSIRRGTVDEVVDNCSIVAYDNGVIRRTADESLPNRGARRGQY